MEQEGKGRMSAIWFVILFLAWGNGTGIDDASYLMLAIFYVGDCILMRTGGKNGKAD